MLPGAPSLSDATAEEKTRKAPKSGEGVHSAVAERKRAAFDARGADQ
jgi:hypothetical protein